MARDSSRLRHGGFQSVPWSLQNWKRVGGACALFQTGERKLFGSGRKPRTPHVSLATLFNPSHFSLVKHTFLAPTGALILGASLLFVGAARAQIAAPVVVPSVSSAQVVASGASVSVPVATRESKVRLRLRNGAAYIDEESEKVDGNLVSARLEAEPGLYLLRAFSPGKNAAQVGAPLSIVVPGVRREAGVWLFNGSLWIPKALPSADGSYNFLENLKRAGKAKTPVSIATPQLANWLTAPPESSAPVAGGRSGMGGTVVGTLVRARGEDGGAAALRNLGENRAVILEVDAASDPLLAARQLENAAREADAVVLKFDGDKPWVSQLWPLKMARRMAEETPEFDLPIFADVRGLSESQSLELYQNGATGFLVWPGEPQPAWARAWDANSNWLVGAVTLEDMGVLNNPSPRLESLLADLRAAGRIPLVGQLPGAGNARGESNMILLDDATTEATLDGVKAAAKAGNTVYVEGLPAPALYAKMGEITGTQVTALAAPRDEVLTLNDPWTWGAISGREYGVTQRVSLTVKRSLAAQTRDQKGLALETDPRATGRLSADPNGWMVCPVGQGRIFWMPQSFNNLNRPNLSSYYAAVAGTMQSALVELEGDRDLIRVALRATQGQTALLGLFNAGGKDAKVTVGLRGDATYIADMLSDEVIPNRVVGFETRFDVSVPANGYRWLALAKTAEEFERERAVKRVKARLK